MKCPYSSLLLPLVILIGCHMTGCGIFNTEPFVDAKKDAQGRSVLLDTPRMWQYFTVTVEHQVARERDKERPPGVNSWEEHWFGVINHIESGAQENASKYVDYIIDARRRAGLPELEGYQRRKGD